MAASEVRKPCIEIPKATVMLISGIVALYIFSMLIIVLIVDWSSINTSISPFVQGFNNMGYGWASALVNCIIIIATLSVMIGSYYGCMQILVSLSEAKEAPQILKSKTSREIYRYSWLATGLAALIIVLLAFVLGTKLFNYLISSSSYFTFFNWIVNLITYIVWLGKRDKNEIYDSPLIKGRLSAVITIVIIIALMVVSLGVSDFRIGFYMALSITVIVSALYKILRLNLEK